MAGVLLASLELVEEEFARRMHGQDLGHYLSSRYLSRVEGRYLSEKGAIWARVWALMTAGHHKSALELIAANYPHYS